MGISVAPGPLVYGWSERFGVPAEYYASGADHLLLPAEIKNNLYRLAQEAPTTVYTVVAAQT